ncbi:unnamed protein product, partial [Amoebophrya sp. A120]
DFSAAGARGGQGFDSSYSPELLELVAQARQNNQELSKNGFQLKFQDEFLFDDSVNNISTSKTTTQLKALTAGMASCIHLLHSIVDGTSCRNETLKRKSEASRSYNPIWNVSLSSTTESKQIQTNLQTFFTRMLTNLGTQEPMLGPHASHEVAAMGSSSTDRNLKPFPIAGAFVNVLLRFAEILATTPSPGTNSSSVVSATRPAAGKKEKVDSSSASTGTVLIQIATQFLFKMFTLTIPPAGPNTATLWPDEKEELKEASSGSRKMNLGSGNSQPDEYAKNYWRSVRSNCWACRMSTFAVLHASLRDMGLVLGGTIEDNSGTTGGRTTTTA